MKFWGTSLVVLFVSLSAAAQITADRLSCGQVQAQVKRTGRYYVATTDGAIPIFPVKSWPNKDSWIDCTFRERPYFPTVQTADSDRCIPGYICIPAK